ncbi:hypothetical protein [Clostridium sp. DJ247]|uniref:hypothetical protein n=1 Tax=Clostridium sp. DJ247 TaxID=2726188 RepID=UPI0016284AC1|nr:hypothetical protein [Clostridium sp. DJ247]MBC2579795.1 hypothetical protein [Clostridium sp. DJ247]
MSRFLAPIHTWLFNKIKLHEDLELTLVNAYKEKYGEEIYTIYNSIKSKYGAPTENKPIEDLIDVDNIHGWLQNKISLTETRAAALLTEISNKNNEDNISLAVEIYSEQGRKCAEEAKEKYEINNASEIYQALNNYVIEGMPCDRVNVVTVDSEEKLQWETERCLHKNYWESINGDVSLFYKLRDAWIKSFVENVNSRFSYKASRSESEMIHEIFKK